MLSDDVIEKQIEDGLLKPELREKISYVLLRKHRHQTKKPIHRSLADIGKSVSSNTSECYRGERLMEPSSSWLASLLHPNCILQSSLSSPWGKQISGDKEAETATIWGIKLFMAAGKTPEVLPPAERGRSWKLKAREVSAEVDRSIGGHLAKGQAAYRQIQSAPSLNLPISEPL